jgi:hypothetical protein
MSDQPPLFEIIPRRNSTYLSIGAGGVLLILVLGGLYAIGLRLAHLTTDGKLAAFDLDSEGSIASWCSIVLLFSCGLTTLLVRRLRVAARCATTEGRLWFAVSVLWFTMSVDEGASLHEAFKELMARLTGTRILGDGSIYWVLPYFLVLTATGLFLLRVARRCRTAIACLLGAGASYAIAVIAQLELFLGNHPAIETCVEESCEMLGGLFILLTLGLHARSVVLELERPASTTAGAGTEQPWHEETDDTLVIESPRKPAAPHWIRTQHATARDRRP